MADHKTQIDHIRSLKGVRTYPGLLLVCLCFGFAFMVVHSAPSFAQSSEDTLNRLNRLQNDIDTLNRAVYRGEVEKFATDTQVTGATSASMEVRIQQLEGEIQSLRGTIEEQSYQVRKLRDDLKTKLGDVELRLKDLENGGGPPQSLTGLRDDDVEVFPYAPQGGQQTVTKTITPSSSLKTAPATKPVSNAIQGSGLTSDQAATMYENAFAMLKAGKYEQAAKGFDSFVQAYPKHALAGNAKYWLGETHYVRGNYDVAARIFAEGYKAFPKGSKAADNLLKLGMSLNGAGNTKDACVAFQQLKAEFANGAAPVLRRAEQEMSRLNCTSS